MCLLCPQSAKILLIQEKGIADASGKEEPHFPLPHFKLAEVHISDDGQKKHVLLLRGRNDRIIREKGESPSVARFFDYRPDQYRG